MLEALEMLELGIQSKCLFWKGLSEVAQRFPEWTEIGFAELEQQASEQRNDIESWRINAARDVLASPKRRNDKCE